MTLARGRVVPAGAARAHPVAASGAGDGAAWPGARGRRVSAEEVAATERAARVLATAEAQASALVAAAEERAAELVRSAERAAWDVRLGAVAEGRAEGLATVARAAVRLREAELAAEERHLSRVVDLATLLAERLVGDSLRTDPEALARRAREVVAEASGARRIVLCAHPDDAATLREVASLLDVDGRVVAVVASESLARGDLRLETDAGVVEASVGASLARLAASLRSALGVQPAPPAAVAEDTP